MGEILEWAAFLKSLSAWIDQVETMVNDDEEKSLSKEETVVLLKEIEQLKTLWPKENTGSLEANKLFLEQLDSVSEKYDKLKSAVKNKRSSQLQAIQPGHHKLPPLPYQYDALEPAISEEIMRLHHDQHHKSYVEGLNKAELEMKKARETNDFDKLRYWEREAAFNGAGHYLHTMFWENMSPRGGGKPSGDLAGQIDKDFGSFEKFKAHFTAAAKQVQGVGWAILIWSPRARRLEILQAEFHHLLSQWDAIPLLGLDVWEHAYYLQYKNNRANYINNFWSVVNWNNVGMRYEKAKQLQWQPF